MNVHFLGIGGSGASAAAALAQAQGYQVTGCDLEPDNEFTTQFKPSQLFKGHDPAHAHLQGVLNSLGKIDILAVTPAIFSLDPTVELGAINPRWKSNYRVGRGKYFVVEADEFNDNFLHLKPDIAVVTNIEMDHPEYFKDFESVKKSFAKFESQSKKVFDKPIVRLINFKLKVPGEFNVANASLAYQVGLALGLDPGLIKKSLANFNGVSRRFEYIGQYNGTKVYSDFGHHPTEIKVTIDAVREKFPNQRILLIYQPHMFSRTKALFDDFIKVFKQVPTDKTFIIDIYPSREVNTGLVSSKQLVEAVNKSSVSYIGKPEETLEKLKPEIKSGDILFFMSAGETDKLAKQLVSSN